MEKIIYQVDFDYARSDSGIMFNTREVGLEYSDNNGVYKTVVSIDVSIFHGKFAIEVRYDDNTEDIIFDILHIYKKLILT